MRHDYKIRRIEYANALGCPYERLGAKLAQMYIEEHMCALEITQRLIALTGKPITVRSIQRLLQNLGVTRSAGDAFRLAVKRNRVHFAYKDPLFKARRSFMSKALRYKILKRDAFKCVLCGITAKEARLEVDHEVAVAHGGQTIESNLRTLCVDCNHGKRVIELER